jgi:NADH-quinone oxidoreductase subunit N
MEFMALSLKESLLLLPMTVVFIFACIPITLKVLNKNIEPSNNTTVLFTSLGLVIAAFLVHSQGMSPDPKFFGALVFDKMATLLNFGIIAVTLFTVFISHSNVNTKDESFAEHTFLLLASATGMMTIASAADLMVLFIGLELMSIALYVLIALGHEQKVSKEAAFKYFILGSFASAILLYGIAFAFGTTGTTQIHDISFMATNLMATNKLFIIAVALIMIGIAFKVSLFPFHAWTPDVYQGAPTPVSAFMATGVKLVMFSAFIRLASEKFFAGNSQLIMILQIMAVATMTVGNITALVQDNIKRIIAYSSIAHAGYMMVGVIAASNTSSPEASAATLFYVLSYCVMNIGAFAIVSVFEKEERGQLAISDYAGLGFKYPFLGIALSVFMLSMAGMPPMVGFLAKFFVFSAAVKEGYVGLTIFAVINSLLSAYYYLKILVTLYMKEPELNIQITSRAIFSRSVIVITLVLTLLFGVMSGLLYGPSLRSMVMVLGEVHV